MQGYAEPAGESVRLADGRRVETGPGDLLPWLVGRRRCRRADIRIDVVGNNRMSNLLAFSTPHANLCAFCPITIQIQAAALGVQQ